MLHAFSHILNLSMILSLIHIYFTITCIKSAVSTGYTFQQYWGGGGWGTELWIKNTQLN